MWLFSGVEENCNLLDLFIFLLEKTNNIFLELFDKPDRQDERKMLSTKGKVLNCYIELLNNKEFYYLQLQVTFPGFFWLRLFTFKNIFVYFFLIYRNVFSENLITISKKLLYNLNFFLFLTNSTFQLQFITKLSVKLLKLI